MTQMKMNSRLLSNSLDNNVVKMTIYNQLVTGVNAFDTKTQVS